MSSGCDCRQDSRLSMIVQGVHIVVKHCRGASLSLFCPICYSGGDVAIVEREYLGFHVCELVTGCLFAAIFAALGCQVELLVALLLTFMLMIIFVSDMVYMLIPNKVLLFFLPLFIIGRLVHPLEPWWSAVAGAVTGAAIIALIILISRGGMGAGDMKLFGVLGFV